MRPMRAWLVTIGEPLPTDPGDERLLRAGILAQALVDAGHDVVWWTSAFNHYHKTMRSERATRIELSTTYRIELLHGGGYRRNISLQRIRDHRRLAAAFAAAAAECAVPDIIVCSFPPIELSLQCVEYGTAHGVPVVLDVRDLWPDIFVDILPLPLRPMGRLALGGMSRMANRALAGATAIWANAPSLLDWGLKRAGRERSQRDAVFPYGYAVQPPGPAELRAATEAWSAAGIREGEDMIVCFAGAIGRQFDFDTVIDAARLLGDSSGIRFVICGTGEQLARLQRRAANLPSIVFAGWRRSAEIWTLLRMSSVGLAPYVERADFLGTIPNKVPEYLSANVPIALSLGSGYLHDRVTHGEFGFSYAGNAPRLAGELLKLRDDPARRRRMAERCAAVFATEFRADIVYRDMIGAMARLRAES
jgi:glycosyltransferase involved in cell wall biosynthesis